MHNKKCAIEFLRPGENVLFAARNYFRGKIASTDVRARPEHDLGFGVKTFSGYVNDTHLCICTKNGQMGRKTAEGSAMVTPLGSLIPNEL